LPKSPAASSSQIILVTGAGEVIAELKISSSYSPPPPEGFISPMTWGVEDTVTERFGEAGVDADGISFSRETYTFEYPAPPTELLAVFREYYGPTMNAFAAAEAKRSDRRNCSRSWRICSPARTPALMQT
jgi:hypothetical protein